MIKVLFLDDSEERIDAFLKLHSKEAEFCAFDIARNAAEAIYLLNANPKYNLVLLDHDLSLAHYQHIGKEFSDTGDVVAKHITQIGKEKIPDMVIVHSWNTYGAKGMMSLLKSHGINCVRKAFDFNSKMFRIDHGH